MTKTYKCHWIIYSIFAWLTLLLCLTTSIILSFDLNRIGINIGELIKLFWSYNLLYYAGFLVIAISAMKKLKIALWFDIFMLVPVAYNFVSTFSITSHNIYNIFIYLNQLNAVFSILTEITCISLMVFIYKTQHNDKLVSA